MNCEKGLIIKSVIWNANNFHLTDLLIYQEQINNRHYIACCEYDNNVIAF